MSGVAGRSLVQRSQRRPPLVAVEPAVQLPADVARDRLEPLQVAPHHLRSVPQTLHPEATLLLELSSAAEAARFVQILGYLVRDAANALTVTDAQGRAHLDVGVEHMETLWASGRLAAVHFHLALAGHPAVLALAHRTAQPCCVYLRAPIAAAQSPLETLWLQRPAEERLPPAVLALPIHRGALAQEAPDALVALASSQGAKVGAQLFLNGSETPSRTWSAGSKVAVPRMVEEPPAAAPEWWARLDELLRDPSLKEELKAHLHTVFESPAPWRIADLRDAPPADFMVPEENGVIASLIPMETEVLVALDHRQSTEVMTSALLHSLAHVVLGHVRPGDRWGHWDTDSTVNGVAHHRLWDQEVTERLSRSPGPRPARRVESLEQCTATERAQLGLCRMIGEMLGESRRLHPAAERYQRAAYQRRAAERLVSMLEDLGGAMLCDGVGLGKTYVATTLIVHHANTWRDAAAADAGRQVDDPYRITVLAPHSVVSTWQREALPPLAAFGVPLASVRVLSHAQLSRMTRASEIVSSVRGGPSDLEHLLLSDLVIVDEAHNFRSLAARRTKVLRDLLRLQPRREQRRRVVLLTATPINNSLEDLRQEVSLLFSRPLWLGDGKKEVYRRQVMKEIRDRLAKAREQGPRVDIAPLVIHGRPDAKFSDSIEFRDDLDFGPKVKQIALYLQEQNKRLQDLQSHIRAAAATGEPLRDERTPRIAEELLDRIVVQRSRALCKDIERQQGGAVELLFRPDAGAPEKLLYSDEYDGIEDVLARFLPLFDSRDGARSAGVRPLSFKIYMWYDVREGIRSPDDTSSVIGLQRVLALKRLESSPVSFLITLVRLTVLHAHRLQQLIHLCETQGDSARKKTLQAEIEAALAHQDPAALTKIASLAAAGDPGDAGVTFMAALSAAYSSDRPAADTDDPPPQLPLFGDDPSTSPGRAELDRLWALREAILRDFETLLSVTPELTDIVFGSFDRREWPRRFIAGGEAIDWPASPAWGLRLVTDAKLRKLVGRLVLARRAGQKVVVFSQFSDTIAYIQSVLRACKSFTRAEWQMVLRGGLGVEHLRSEELTGLLAVTSVVTGNTEDRDDVVNAFAPFYRIGPARPAAEGLLDAADPLQSAWDAAWIQAIVHPVDVLLATDVLAEGVNLQDAALLVNFDVHWNPVRMIQRAGRIDRRLNPRIEHAADFPDVAALAARLGRPVPRYYWHAHPGEPPVTVNMILPDELEAELLLRERLATKTLAIDFTLGLEQGTGAEADWMASYKYQGITSLSSFEKDRAIEQISGHHERLTQRLRARGVRLEWAENLNGWFRAPSAAATSPLVGRALLGRRGGALERFSRYLEPAEHEGAPHWCWAEGRPGESMYDGWLVLDGKAENFPPHPRRDIPFHESVSMPVRASHLLAAAEQLTEDPAVEALLPRDIGRPLMQGASALAAPKLGSDDDRRHIALRDFFVLQLPSFEPVAASRPTGRTGSIPPAPAVSSSTERSRP